MAREYHDVETLIGYALERNPEIFEVVKGAVYGGAREAPAGESVADAGDPAIYFSAHDVGGNISDAYFLMDVTVMCVSKHDRSTTLKLASKVHSALQMCRLAADGIARRVTCRKKESASTPVVWDARIGGWITTLEYLATVI